ncbi:MAG: hypothetical protein ABIN17_01895 [candidate division WOR-3 bacterium]
MEEIVKRILVLLMTIMFFYSCKEREGIYLLRVSVSSYSLGIDIVSFNEQDSTYFFPYDTLSATFTFDAHNTSEEGYSPILSIDSLNIEFYDMSQSPPKKISFNVAPPYQGNVSIPTYSHLKYVLPVELKKNSPLTLTLPLLPSYIKEMYNPFYNVWKNRNPEVLYLKARYTFYSHEYYSGKILDPVSLEITLEVSDFADQG